MAILLTDLTHSPLKYVYHVWERLGEAICSTGHMREN